MSLDFEEAIRLAGLGDDVIDFFKQEKIYEEADFANAILTAEQIKTTVFDGLCGEPDRWTLMRLTRFWRSCQAVEKGDAEKRASGASTEPPIEEALPSETVDFLTQRFEDQYRHAITAETTLCDTLMGRIKREIQKANLTVIPIERVKSQAEKPSGKQTRRCRSQHTCTCM